MVGNRLMLRIVVVVLPGIFSCMSSGTLVNTRDFNRFAEHKATRSEVRSAIGSPDLDLGNCDGYEYVTQDLANSKRVDFCYDARGVLKSKRCVGRPCGNY
jgi:hypothetical protein